jgi:electron-transferring-flavoprotein dehydrogenase
MNGIEQWLLKGHIPWTLRRSKPDHLYLKPAAECKPIAIRSPMASSPSTGSPACSSATPTTKSTSRPHLTLKDPSVPVEHQPGQVRGARSRYCPAGVYEFVGTEDGGERLQINAQNCVHCKTCDIKDPTQNIVWVTPEGGGGPNYVGM